MFEKGSAAVSIRNTMSKVKRKFNMKNPLNEKSAVYLNRYKRNCFSGTKCSDIKQYEAVITRWYHTIEKGLAYTNFRAGFGGNNIEKLLQSMENYVKDGFDKDAYFFRTALSVLDAYQVKNCEYGVENVGLQARIDSLGGFKNSWGGILEYSPLSSAELESANYEKLILSRHSMRHFSSKSVDIDRVKKAVTLAQQTPSACNRQGWRTIIINDKDTMKKVLKNQNGNEGFGHEFDKLLLVVTDIRYFNKDREIFQPFIDGGMYAQSLLNALHYEHIATCPLSASLRKEQEENIRRILSLNDAEMPIIFIGIGNYPEDKCQTTKSERKVPEIQLI